MRYSELISRKEGIAYVECSRSEGIDYTLRGICTRWSVGAGDGYDIEYSRRNGISYIEHSRSNGIVWNIVEERVMIYT